jgi:hypothetical protein
MTHWQYRAETFQHSHGGHNFNPSLAELIARLNVLGAEGWEAYQIEDGVVYMKRDWPGVAPPRPGDD